MMLPKFAHIPVHLLPLTAIACLSLLGFWIAVEAIPYVFGFDTNVLFTIGKYLKTGELYTNPNTAPFDIAQYMPLYYEVVAFIGRVARIPYDDHVSLMILARMVSVGASLLSLTTFILIARRHLGISLLSALAAVSIAYVAASPWLFTARPDSLALLVTSFALFLTLEALSKPSLILCLLATLAAFAAVCTKQSAVIVFLFVNGALLLDPRTRRYALGSLLVAAVATGIICWHYGRFFPANVVDGLNNGIALSWTWEYTYFPYFSQWYCFTVVVGAFLLASLLPGGTVTCNQRLILVFSLTTFGFNVLTALKWGSTPNYFIEFNFCAGLLAAALCSTKEERSTSLRFSNLAPVFLISYAILVPVHLVQELYWNYWLKINPSSSFTRPVEAFQWSNFQPLKAMIKTDSLFKEGGHILSFSKPMTLVCSDVCIIPQIEVAERCYKQKAWDNHEFARMVREGQVKFIISEKPELQKEFLGVSLHQFKLTTELSGLYVFSLDQ
jgi:hypothetical protein